MCYNFFTMKHLILLTSSLFILALTSCKNNSQVLESRIAALEDSIAKLSSSSEQQTSTLEKFNYDDSESEDISTWRTYNNQTITFKYPNNFSISDEDIDEKGFSSMNVGADGDDLLALTITYATNPIFKLMSDYSESDAEGDIESFKEGMQEYYSDITMSEISKTSIGVFNGFKKSYQATLLGIKVKGDCFVSYKDNHVIMLMTQAEYQQNTEILTQIMKTISFCK